MSQGFLLLYTGGLQTNQVDTASILKAAYGEAVEGRKLDFYKSSLLLMCALYQILSCEQLHGTIG